jgi:hypothetical protein
VKRIVLLLAMLAFAGPAAGQPSAADVTVRATVDRTAVWVGDRVRYTLEFRCSGDLDVLPDDLTKERLPIRGGEVLDVETTQEETAEGTVRRTRYTLVTYAVDTTEMAVDAFPVRYFSRRTVGADTQARPTGQLTVPRTVVAIRSTLPDSGRLPELREPALPRPAPRYVSSARRVGLTLIALAIVPVALVVLDIAGRLRRLRAGAPRRQTRRQHATAMEELTALHPDSQEERIAAFQRLDQVVREHLQLVGRIPAPALTPDEIGRTLESRTDPAEAQSIATLLETCERARYAPEPIRADDWSAAIAAAESVVRRRTL